MDLHTCVYVCTYACMMGVCLYMCVCVSLFSDLPMCKEVLNTGDP